MGVKLRNLLASGPVVVPLNTGATVRLSPGQTSDELADVEVTDNAKVEKLRRLGLIEVETTGRAAKAADADGESTDSQPDATSRRSPRKRSETSR
ncbi:hypothetical protein [Rugosimonospora africana]|uniref:Uncharacterized protein n=1 Tax=Rugosimonospora africana TaxID=556532 RepID=A0A8J3VPN9_9ACTN|nr:hypothetical protein [Rugosimonospora africana]GIH14157.1 hypothetical protein Raf01_23290 [Rugosimonospora africana]